MRIDKVENPLFAKTAIFNNFMADYLPELDPFAVKLYVYLVYASENHINSDKQAIANLFNCDISLIDAAIVTLESLGLITCTQEFILICDLAQKEIERNYRPKTVWRPDDAFALSDEDRQARAKLQKAISDKFFSGRMPITWYNEIDSWFEKYAFTPEVVFSLFQHCQDNHIMTKPYVSKVAESWAERYHIKTLQQLDSYLSSYKEYKTLRDTVAKKLKLKRQMNTYEEEIIEKWHYTYGYSFDIVEIALKKSVTASNPTLALFDAIITQWHKNGLKTVEEVNEYIEKQRKKYAQSGMTSGVKESSASTNSIPQKKNYEQRSYSDDFDNFYEDKKDE